MLALLNTNNYIKIVTTLSYCVIVLTTMIRSATLT